MFAKIRVLFFNVHLKHSTTFTTCAAEMSLKLAANLNFLFTEGTPTILEKMCLAKNAGFRAIEIPFPDKKLHDSIRTVKAETGLEVALINIALGTEGSAFGTACITGHEETFKQQLTETVTLAKSLDCKKIHIMAGLQPKDGCYDDNLKTYTDNLKYAAKYLECENILGVIEPINKYALPGYFMNSYDTAITILNQINSPNLKLLVDIYHLQHIRGNLTNTFKENAELVGHIQIAQVPHRNEPDIAGELNFEYVFKLIESSGYSDWIGCEYKPKTNTTEGLKWLNAFGLKL